MGPAKIVGYRIDRTRTKNEEEEDEETTPAATAAVAAAAAVATAVAAEDLFSGVHGSPVPVAYRNQSNPGASRKDRLKTRKVQTAGCIPGAGDLSSEKTRSEMKPTLRHEPFCGLHRRYGPESGPTTKTLQDGISSGVVVAAIVH